MGDRHRSVHHRRIDHVSARQLAR
jgi:hypothetical protein